MKINNTILKKTKIVATAGPTTETVEQFKEAFKNGVNVVRLNTSHGSFEEHGNRIKNIKKARKELDLPISILLDTKGPEIRVNEIKNKKMEVNIGDILEIHCEKEILGEEGKFSISYKKLPDFISKNDLIMVDDGKLTLFVLEVNKNKRIIKVECKNKHFIGTKKAINVPGLELDLPFLSEYDKNFIKWGIEQGVDYIAASFVRSGDDLKDLRSFLNSNKGENIEIISKIESLSAIKNINLIVKLSDGIMLARGDLGVEIPYFKVPFYEKLIISKCRAWGKPIIIATQMLDSMMDNPRPTRAEVTDIYYAIVSGTDSTMLSGETASGKFPIDSIETMRKIQIEGEKNFNFLQAFEEAYAFTDSSNADSAYKVSNLALTLDSKYIIAFSEKGRLIKILSRFRPKSNIIALIKDKNIINKFGLNYGVNAQHYNNLKDFENDDKIIELSIELGIEKGTKVIVANKDKYKILVI